MKKLTISQFPALSYAGQEAINTLCTNLSFSGENVKKIMVTSSHASEGKSFLTMNIMRTLAKYGKRCIEDFVTLFQTLPKVDAGLAASIFHFHEVDLTDLKTQLAGQGIPMRL